MASASLSLRRPVRLGACILLLAAVLCPGCNVLGLIASKSPPPMVPAAYSDLAGRSTAIWVWVEPGADIDYPALSLQIATSSPAYA